jgi:phage terminase large subunit
MTYSITTATQKIRALKKRIRAVQGGTSASKTVGILQNLIDFAQTDKVPTLTSVVSETMPHLKKGAELDFLNILKAHNYYNESRWHRTDHQYTFETGSIIEFFSADDSSKVHGPRRDRLFMNEANNQSFEVFDQLELRTNQFVYLDWNPVEDFWFYDEVEGKRDDMELLVLNYMDNEAIPDEIRKSLESRKHRKNWWKVYGLGQRGEVEGRIYTGWNVEVDEIPHEARLERYGVDFGYTNDPTAIVAVYYYNGGYILDEIEYRKLLSNQDIADVILNTEKEAIVIADSAEPKSIDEIKDAGVSILPAEKGPDSVRNGIQNVQEQRISVTKRSVNLIKEYRNYLWATDKDGKFLSPNEPEHEFSHAMDAVRYAITSIKRPSLSSMTVRRPTYSGFNRR